MQELTIGIILGSIGAGFMFGIALFLTQHTIRFERKNNEKDILSHLNF